MFHRFLYLSYLFVDIRMPERIFTEETIKEARRERQREIMMANAVKECIVTGIFLWIIYSISYSNRDSRSYQVHDIISKHFVYPVGGQPTFPSVSTMSYPARVCSQGRYTRWRDYAHHPVRKFLHSATSVSSTHGRWRRKCVSHIPVSNFWQYFVNYSSKFNVVYIVSFPESWLS